MNVSFKHSVCFLFLIIKCLLAEGQDISIYKREHLLMDFGWRFAFGHPFDTKKDFNSGSGYFSYFAKAAYGDGAAAANFDDRAWRKLDLPHDWAVEQPFSPEASYSHGFKAIGRNFPAASVGWYRKTFTIPAADLGRQISVQFDGVFRNASVWVNGHYLGNEPSGYNSFSFNISEYLNYGSNNVIAVRVDATMEEGWFYEGAGIYRHVWLNKTNPLHVATYGTFVTTQVQQKNAIVNANVTVVNEEKEPKIFELIQSIMDAEGKTVSTEKTVSISLKTFESKEISTALSVSDAKRWDLESPYLYKLITTVSSNDTVFDSYETVFGIRTIRFDAKEGFFLNGKNIKLQGTNNHQDHAGVGAAMPDELQYFRIRSLKAMGCNAYRCSHNPPTPELLDACDRLGMLVIDENRLMGITNLHLNDLKRMILRDRNHPSIFSWSIGNEEWGIEGNTRGERIAITMQNFVKSLDTTRTTTAGISGGFRSGISSVLEVMGYNYLGNGDIEAHQKKFPNQPGMATEEGSTFATRGIYITDEQKHLHAAYDKKPRPSFYSIEEAWKFYAARPYLAGLFIWTGFDYRGEPTPYGWPSVTSYFGMMDLCGFPKDNVYYLKSWWTQKPILHLLPHWNWKGREGNEIEVWAYSNCEEVELFLNKKSLGKKKMEQYGHLEWKVNYQPGTLEAIGYKNGKKTMTEVVTTTETPTKIKMSAHKSSVLADGEDISIITVETADKKNLFVPDADNEVSFAIEGPGKIIGIGNGSPVSLEKEKFIETIQTVSIDGLKEKEISAMEQGAEMSADINDASWKEAFKNRDYKNLAKAYIHHGSFTLPENFSASEITFFYKSIGKEQSIYINGKEIAKNIQESEFGNEYKLDKKLLKIGKNDISIVATPIPKKHEWDNVNIDPGLIQLVTKPTAWKRKLFNGLLQIIIQSTKSEGEITLTATSENVSTGILKIKSNPIKARPSVDQYN